MTDDILDRCAMAIAIVRGNRWATVSETNRKLTRLDADAVLTALAEPTDWMLAAGVAQIEFAEDGGLLGGTEELVLNIFRAMLKEARR